MQKTPLPDQPQPASCGQCHCPAPGAAFGPGDDVTIHFEAESWLLHAPIYALTPPIESLEE